jgi:hypothetical protein
VELNKIMGNNMGNYCSEICNSDHDVFELNMKRNRIKYDKEIDSFNNERLKEIDESINIEKKKKSFL